ncbi:hypothetical protein DY000_02009601 [Brassica cretica]|uniref:PheRS DNA binding domain-containing protein n=1 Tax=Brassica cretica TaxID=69181 RepID=A0ABQ7C3J2_BRACR|nr:hypothetical protein DY000_02009601 [Brassica cretica]
MNVSPAPVVSTSSSERISRISKKQSSAKCPIPFPSALLSPARKYVRKSWIIFDSVITDRYALDFDIFPVSDDYIVILIRMFSLKIQGSCKTTNQSQIPVNSQRSTISTTKKSKTSSRAYKVSAISKLRSPNGRHWLTDDGKKYAAEGSPEIHFFSAIPEEGSISKDDLEKKLDPSVFKIGSTQAAKKRWVAMGKQVSRKVQHVEDKVKESLLRIQQGLMLRIDSRTRYLMQKTTSSHCEFNLLTKFNVSALACPHGSSVDRCYGMSVDRCYGMSVDRCYGMSVDRCYVMSVDRRCLRQVLSI